MRRVRQGGAGLFLVTVLLVAGPAATAPADAAPTHAGSGQSQAHGHADDRVDKRRDRSTDKAHDRALAERDATADQRSSNSTGTARTASSGAKGGVSPTAKPQAATPAPAAVGPVLASSIGTPVVVTGLPAGTPVLVSIPVRPIGPTAVGTRVSQSIAPDAQIRPSPPKPVASRSDRPPAAASAFLASLSPGSGAARLRATTRTSVPIALAGVVLLLLVVLAQIDKRDPKLARAPLHRDDGGMTFK